MFQNLLRSFVGKILDLAQAAGLIRRVKVIAKVVVTHDDRLCKICRPYDGKEYTIEHNLSPQEALQQMQWLQEGVRSGDRSRTPPTLPKYHPRCRCDVKLEAK